MQLARWLALGSTRSYAIRWITSTDVLVVTLVRSILACQRSILRVPISQLHRISD
jgi:hypothetical protein